MTKNVPTAEQQLLEHLSFLPDSIIHEYFDLARRLITELKISDDDPRLALTLPKGSSSIRFNINTRVVLDFKVNRQNIEDSIMSFILPKNDLDQFLFDGATLENFALNAVDKRLGRPSPVLIKFPYSKLSTRDPELFESWISAAKVEFDSAKGSSYRNSHNPVLLKAILEDEFRQELLKKAKQFPIQRTGFYRKGSPGNHFPLNSIFFGPPGTGKTYFSKSEAVRLLDGGIFNNRELANKRYAELYNQGRVQFVTFHQSMSYEDFVEGIKPELSNDNEEEGLRYKIEDGIFKQMCVQAAYEYVKIQQASQSAKRTLTFSQLYDDLLNEAQEKLDKGEQVLLPLKSGHQIEVCEISSQGNFVLQHQEGQRKYTVSKSRLEKLYNEIDDFDQIPNIYSYFGSIIGGSNASAYWAVLNQIFSRSTEVQLYEAIPIDYTSKRKAFERIIWSEVDAGAEVPKYLLIIDEINRGNIASILGELITLLEPDKRGGNEESLEVTLPYSKSKFAVPPNLYLIGTMNTADRSVEALDSALRRRFSFREMLPRPDLLRDIEVPGLQLDELLTAINSRIEKLIDKDHTIGHAYFMPLKKTAEPWLELRSIFQNKILPLLQEYFFGNFGKLELVIGEDFFEEAPENNVPDFFARSSFDPQDLLDRQVYRLKDWLARDENPEDWRHDDASFRKAVIRIYDHRYVQE